MTQRVAVYVDGFNLYYGLKAKRWGRYYWLDLVRLAENLLRPGQQLAAVRYFTALVFPKFDDPDKPLRQNVYLEALATLPALRVHMGYHVAKRLRCPSCGAVWQTHEEKRTDVNVAVLTQTGAGDHVVIDNDPQVVESWRLDQTLVNLFGLETARSARIEALMKEQETLLQEMPLTARTEDRLRHISDEMSALPTAERPEDLHAMEIIRQAAAEIQAERGDRT